MSRRIEHLLNLGFKVVGRNILRRSQTDRTHKPCGYINNTNYFFFSPNVHPFKEGVNYFDDGSILDKKQHQQFILKESEKERNDFKASYKSYIEATSLNSTFNSFLQDKIRTYLGKNPTNFYDLRGITNGYMEGAVCFPFFDIDNNFLTAQVLKYGANGKRLKGEYVSNWFHSYKPIKRTLGYKINDKYQVKVNCFFGENYLKGSTNPVAIVEAPKTAVILKELYPNIDWIATAGEQHLFSKDLSVLKDKNVVIFADAHTTLWKEFAGKQGFQYCDILDIEGIKEGSDIADFILDETSIVFSELHEYIFSLNAGFFNFEINKNLLELDFKTVGKEQGYFTAVPFRWNGIDVLHQKDNSKGFKIGFKGKYFNLFNDKYWILNANIDWHKQDRAEGGILVGMNEKSFIWHLQKCYRTLKYLNDVESLADHYVIQHANRLYTQVFEKTLDTLLIDSNFRFSKAYVLNILVPLWDGYNADLNRFKKYRDWKYTGGDQLTRKEFERELNNDKFKHKLNIRLLAFSDALEENRFIDIETDLGLNSYSKNRGYIKIFNLVKQWNSDVIGSSTLKNYLKRQDFYGKIIDCTKSLPPHIIDIYRVAKKWYSNKSLSEISKITGFKNRKYIKEWLCFSPNEDTRTLIKKEIENLLDSIKHIEPLRSEIGGKTRIHNFEYFAPVNQNEEMYKHRLDPAMAFPSKEELLKHRDKIDTEYLPPSINKEEYVKNLKIAINNEINLLESNEKKRDKTNNNKVVPLPVDVFRREETSVFEAV